MPRVFPPLPQGLGGFMYGLFPPLEHHPLSCAAFPVGSPARAATSFHPAGGRGVLCAMRDPCACVYQRTIAQVSRAFCAILAQNVGIVRKTCRAEGKACPKRETRCRSVLLKRSMCLVVRANVLIAWC